MCSIFTSPVYTSCLDLNITRVECHPEKILVRFWGRCNNVCELDYHILHNEVQNAAKTCANIAVGIANSSTKDFISSVEVFQVLTGPIFEQRFHKNNDELTVLPNEEPIIKKFESIIQQNRTLATDFECCFSFTVMLDKRNVANYNFQKGCNMVGNCRVNCADLMNFFRLG
ncbi:dual specificity protein phosphatase 23 isoform X2 [Heterodontus francisci]